MSVPERANHPHIQTLARFCEKSSNPSLPHPSGWRTLYPLGV